MISVRGFTLVELLVVVSILVILTGAIIPSFNAYIDNQNITQAIETIKSDLITTRTRALTGEEAINSVCGSGEACYWMAFFGNGSNKYSFFLADNTTCTSSESNGSRKLVSTSPVLAAFMRIRNTSDVCIFFKFNNADASMVGSSFLIVGPSGQNEGCRRLQVNSAGLVVIDRNSRSCNI